MLRISESQLKFFLKMRTTHPVRSVLLLFFGARTNRTHWHERMLIVNLEAMGDLVMFTGILKHYKKSFPEKKIYLLIKSGSGMERMFREHFVDEMIPLRYKRFSWNPFYGFALINSLRRIGFSRVIDHDFSAAEAIGKIVSVSLGAEEVVGYEGQETEFIKPFDFQQAKTVLYVRRHIFPRYTKLIPTIPSHPGTTGYLPHEISYYKLVYEAASETKAEDYAPELFYDPARGPATLKKFGLTPEKYVVMNINSGARCKCWPPERFAEIARHFHTIGLTSVLIGAPSEVDFVRTFEEMCSVPIINIAGKTNFDELTALVANSFLVFANDTSTIHLAVALKKPSLCIVGGGQFGVAIDYGYEDINRWVYRKTECYFDNWRCCRGLSRDEAGECIEAVSVQDALAELKPLLSYAQKTKSTKKLFTMRLTNTPAISFFPARTRKIKIIYTGIVYEYYESGRESFEHRNFYQTLARMPEVELIAIPYNRILKVGRERFNNELLDSVRREKPDLFFAFMFSDELEPATLDGIKKHTTSIGWFADDEWRLYNYSQHYAPHFTFAVTTWSLAPLHYAALGIENVLRSPWASNPEFWKPTHTKKTIDVSFIGKKNAARERIIQTLRPAGIHVLTRGAGWPEGRATHEEMLDIISSSRINLNLNDTPDLFSPRSLGRLVLRRSLNHFVPSFDFLDNFWAWLSLRVPQAKARPYELSAAGAFVISGRADDTLRSYAEDTEMVFYRDADDLIQKIRYYLNHEDEAKRIADAGHRRTLAEHTYEERFRHLWNEIGI